MYYSRMKKTLNLSEKEIAGKSTEQSYENCFIGRGGGDKGADAEGEMAGRL